MHGLRSPQDAYRRVEFEARIAGADPLALVSLCYEQLASALGTAIHAAAASDNARKSAALTRALAALTALQMGLDHGQPIASALTTYFEAARKIVLGSVLDFDPAALEQLKGDVSEIAAAFRASSQDRE